MPVRFRGVSEYSSMYKWQPSYRSAEFQPSSEQLHLEAGLRSDQLNLLIEPSFDKKKQVPHRRPEAASCLTWFYDEADDSSSEISFLEKNRSKTNTVVKSKKNASEKKTRKSDQSCQTPDKKETKTEEKSQKEGKCTWERDQQSEYIQKIREKIQAEEKEKLLKKKTSPVKSRHRSSPKNTKSKQQSPAKLPRETSPTKPKQNARTKEAKRSTPLRYRPLHQRMLSNHQSEYQQMYKKPSRFIPSSPLISALDVVYSHSPAIPPYKSPKMSSKSEYASKYQPQSPLSKSMPSFSSPPSPALKMKVRDLTSPYRHKHHSQKKVESEYANQFPERDFPTNGSMKVQDEARHNKLNRDGSVFDKDHMTQICSPNNKCWEVSSVSTITASEATVTTNGNSEAEVKKSDEMKAKKLETLPEQEEEIEEVEEDDVESIIERDSLDTRSAVTSCSLNQPMPVARKLAWGGDDETSTLQGSAAESKSDSGSFYEGRLPTPQLNQIGGALRTHHDLTTPSHGGALLTSPSSSEKTKRFSQSAKLKQGLCQDLNLDEKPVKLSKTMPSPSKPSDEKENVQKPVKVSNTLPAPVENVQSKSKASEKRSSEEKLTSNSPKPKLSRKPDIPRFLQPSVRVPIQGALRSQEFQHCGRFTRPGIDFDKVSRASCASLASADDLLQRSLQRKDFWKTK